MRTKIIDNNSISCIPEDSDDLIILRRIIKKGDRIVGETVRVIKQEKDFARPDKGERIRIRLSLEVEKIARELAPENDFKSLMQRTSTMLSDITQLAGVVMLPRSEQSELQHMEFVSLSGNRVLVIMVVNDREVQNRIINTTRRYSSSELQEASNYLNEILVDLYWAKF